MQYRHDRFCYYCFNILTVLQPGNSFHHGRHHHHYILINLIDIMLPIKPFKVFLSGHAVSSGLRFVVVLLVSKGIFEFFWRSLSINYSYVVLGLLALDFAK